MAGPVNGINGQQSFPAANTAANQTQNDKNVREDQTQIRPQGNGDAPDATEETQGSETRNQSVSSGSDSQGIEFTGNEQRGSLLDITV